MAAVALTLAFLQCTEFTSPYVPTVTNNVDSFEYQVSVNGVTRTVRYTWTNTGSLANVNLSSAVTAGTATVTINDADGALIYAHALDGSGTAGTGSGTSGEWMIVVTLTNVTGTVHFSVQKP